MGQTPYYRFQRLSMRDGMSNNTIYSVLKDRNGFLWIGTARGLNRYDGYLYKFFFYSKENKNSIPDNSVRDIKEDQNGMIWIATDNGICKYDPISNKFKRYLSSADSLNKFSITRILITRDQKIWITSKLGISYLDEKNDNFYPFINNKNDSKSIPQGGGMDLEEDSEGNIWIALWPNTLCKYNNKDQTFSTYNSSKDTSSILYNTSIFNIDLDKAGNVWITCAFNKENGVFILRPKINLITRFEITRNNCYSLAYDNLTNSMWIGTMREGIYKVNLTTMEREFFRPNYNDENSLSDFYPSCLYIDADDNLWVGTMNFGLNKLRLWEDDLGQLLELPSKYVTSEFRINKLLEDMLGNIWVSCNNGTFCFVNKTNTVREYFTDNSGSIPKHMCKFREGVLVSSGTGQHYYISSKTGQPIDWMFKGLELSEILAVYQASNSDIWVCADFGLFCYKNGKLDQLPIEYLQKSLPDLNRSEVDQVEFKEYQNKLWVNISSNILKIDLDFKDTTRILFPKPNWNTITLKRNSEINNYLFINDTLYVGTEEHYTKINIKTNDVRNNRIPWIFPSEVIPNMIPLDETKIFYSTYRGLFTYNLTTRKSVEAEFIDISRINPNEVILASDHKIYFAVNNGIMAFDPIKTEKYTNIVPELIITDFYLQNLSSEPGTPNSPLKQSITFLKNITLSYKDNIFGFEMCLLNYDPLNQNGYMYKLEGFDKEWNKIGKRKVATFTNIPPGEYTLLYKAHDKNGNWSETKALKIEITPPFWETWWFRLMAVASLIALIYLIIQLRLRALRKQKEELEEQVEIRTAEIQQQKREITIQNEEILTQNEEIRQQSDQIVIQLEQIEKQNAVIQELYQEQTDSIHTAQRIQQSILPPDDLFNLLIPNHFVLYLPKDIVSGDFYWIHQEGNYTYLAAIDCTGHGVAGAFMTLIAHDLLNEIVKEKGLDPKQMLDKLNRLLIDALHQESENAVTKDGMDVAIVRIEKGSQIMQFASAQHKLFIIRNKELIVIDGDKNSIGIQPKGKIAQFVLQSLHVHEGDQFYLFSDGYPGQFGGTNGEEKLKYNRFRELIHSAHMMPMEQQGTWLKNMLEKWKKDTDQTDDIMVIGFQI
ncbi:MAG: two-component regulator propeller domain-containing protein [Bacteroidota bacterium]|nr:two-component regulator propeller domain-containing protein [Bacteroidota bacterium]